MPSLVYIFLGLFNLYNMNVIVSLTKRFKLVLSVMGRRPRASVVPAKKRELHCLPKITNITPPLYSSLQTLTGCSLGRVVGVTEKKHARACPCPGDHECIADVIEFLL